METNLKQRNGCITAWLWVAILANIGMAIFYAVTMFDEPSAITALGTGLCSICGVVNVLGAILLMRWNKTGFYLFLVASLIATIVNISMLSLPGVTVISSLVSIVIWWAILQAKRNGVSAWSQLESGWDYSHCRYLYQVFAIAIVVVLVLSIIAAATRNKSNPEEPEPDDEEYEYVEADTVEVLADDIITIEDSVMPTRENPKPSPATASEKKEKDSDTREKPAPRRAVDSDEGDSSNSDAADKLLRLAVENGNKEFPQDTGVGIVVTRMYISGDYVMYMAECDEDLIDMGVLESNLSSLKTELRSTFADNSDADIKQFLKICVKAGKGIGYTYVGDTTGKKVVVRFSNSELKRFL